MEKLPALFKLKVRDLGTGSHPVDLIAPSSELDIPMFHGDVRVSGEIIVSERLELRLHVQATGTFTCDRCAVEFERTMNPELVLLYVPPQLAKDVEEDDNIHTFIPQQTFEIDFTEDVRDALLLSIPMKNLHSPDCKGVELDGEPVMLDERLAKLGSLYERLREEEMNSDASGGVSQG